MAAVANSRDHRGVPLSVRRRSARTSPILLLFNPSLSLLATLPRAFEVYGTLSSPAIKRITKIGYIEYQFPREIIPPAPYARQPYCDLHRMAAVRTAGVVLDALDAVLVARGPERVIRCTDREFRASKRARSYSD